MQLIPLGGPARPRSVPSVWNRSRAYWSSAVPRFSLLVFLASSSFETNSNEWREMHNAMCVCVRVSLQRFRGYLCACASACECLCLYLCVCVWVWVYDAWCVHVSVCVCACVCVRGRGCACTLMHLYAYACSRTCVCVWAPALSTYAYIPHATSQKPPSGTSPREYRTCKSVCWWWIGSSCRLWSCQLHGNIKWRRRKNMRQSSSNVIMCECDGDGGICWQRVQNYDE